MITTLINPPGIEEEYINCLNICFPGWGDRRAFDWYFRSANADLLLFQKDGRMAAGSGLTYRPLTLSNGKTIDSGIMTGSWTLPEFRRQGFFTRTIGESLQLAAQRGAALLLAFVTEDNSSFRALASAGAALFPTWYFFSATDDRRIETVKIFHAVMESNGLVDSIFTQLEERNRRFSRFTHSGAAEFELRFLARPGGIAEIFHDEDGCFGIVQSKEKVDQLQLLLSSGDKGSLSQSLGWFLNRALDRDRQFFMFSTDPAVAQAAKSIGLDYKNGYLTVLVADQGRLRSALGVPDKAPPLTADGLTQPESPWFIGPWSIPGGDRA